MALSSKRRTPPSQGGNVVAESASVTTGILIPVPF